MRTSLVSIILIIASFAAHSHTRYGIIYQLEANSLITNHDLPSNYFKLSTTIGNTIGRLVEFPISESFSIESHLRFSFRQLNLKPFAKTSHNQLSIPLLVNYYPKFLKTSNLSTFVQTGPQLAIHLASKHKSTMDFERFLVNWNVGAGVELSSHYRIALSYEIGIKPSVGDYSELSLLLI